MLPVSALNTIVPEKVVQKISFNELKIKKVKFLAQSRTKIFCINIFDVGGCLASLLTFMPLLTLDPQ